MSFGERKLPVRGLPDRLQKVPRGLAEFAAGHFSDEPANSGFSESTQARGARPQLPVPSPENCPGYIARLAS